MAGAFALVEMIAYKYENMSHAGYTNVLWTCRDQICFQSPSRITGWHGSVTEHDGTMTLRFDCKGRTHRLKSTFLMRSGVNSWSGIDYRGRTIKMTKLAFYQKLESEAQWTEIRERSRA